jgi:plastocyanin
LFPKYKLVVITITMEARMRKGKYVQGWVRMLLAGATFMMFSATLAHATVHVVKFGGTLGQTYDPSSISVAVGDTVQWQGAFSFHPLSSTTIPPGATSWHSGSGTVFSYVVEVPGTYNYQCDVHEPAMSGSFSATLSGVQSSVSSLGPVRLNLEQNYPNPFNPATGIGYEVGVSGQSPVASMVKLAVYDLLGREVAVLVNEREEPGIYRVQFNGSGLPSGLYMYKLSSGTQSITRTMVVLK